MIFSSRRKKALAIINTIHPDLGPMITFSDNSAIVAIPAPPDQAAALESTRAAIEKALIESRLFTSVNVILTHHSPIPTPSPRPQAPHPPRSTSLPRISLPTIAATILIASGKGGVGKSTVAVNLALGLVAMGKRVGLLDGDIHGPSIACMMGLEGKPESRDGKTILPKEKYGLRCMSIGLMTGTDTAVIWRGPMVQSALMQLLGDVDWGELDVLVVDMPPGTGDIQLTLAQQVRLTGAVVVSTPQEVALLDVRRSINMFIRTQVPILGVVENMAYFISPESREKSYIFGMGGARRMADEMNVPFLGEIPLMAKLREGGDTGSPVLTDPDSPEAQPFLKLAHNLWQRIQERKGQPAPSASA